jgi:nitric oxide reductase subunit B
MKNKFSILFIVLGLSALTFGALIGVFSSIIYAYPDFLKDIIPFNQLRPMHTTSVVSWIILTATGGLYFYLTTIEKIQLRFPVLGKAHAAIFILTGVGIYFSLFTGKMGGREYLEYFPVLTIPILLGWVLFGINYFSSMLKQVKNWPVYFWMWGTGIVFMCYHLSEAHFWIFSEIRNDFIKDLSIQWKSYGSFVGSWNLLVYGTAIYLMAKIKGDDNVGRGKESFFFYFLGLTNLMFGWAHHTYIIPTVPWIRYVAYLVSMTEWIIFIHIVYNWAKSLSEENKKVNLLAYRFLMASEIWVFLNLTLALLMSIPTLNFFMHGTHITVAHSMGTTIGINSSILLASVSFIVSRLIKESKLEDSKVVTAGFYIFNWSLLIFWVVLIWGGIYKALFMSETPTAAFSSLQEGSSSIFIAFIISGCILFSGLAMITLPMINKLSKVLLSK